ncbi:MAG: T9SS type A sorting domain-containing protein, partial [Saprospiraceae bacterium]|nr:T9SS type A sorting domain-containing protein [Saprospiraceae bacterium]
LSILAPGTYQIRVQSVCTDKVSNYSSVFEYTANFLCPGISNLYINDIRQEHVTLRWLNVVGAEKFNLYLQENGVWTLHEFPIDSVKFGRADMQYIFRGLKPGTKYKALLRAVCKNQDTGEYYEGYAQNTQDFETMSLCDKPENLSASVGQTTVYLSWTPVPGATKYRIDYFDYAKNYWTTNPSLEFITDPYRTMNVDPGSLVTVRVVAYCSGSSTSLPSDSLTFETVHCETPDITVSNIKKNAATIGWTAPVGANVAVEIYRPSDNYWSHSGVSGDKVSYTPYLLANTVHYARVVFLCGGGIEHAEMTPLIPFKTLSTDVVVGTEELPDPLALQLFPNPTSGFFTVEWAGQPESEAFDYEIRNLYGALLQRGRFTTSPSTIDATALASGMYLLDIKGRAQRQVLPFVKI